MSDDTMAWTDKYRPETFAEIQGNNKALKGLREWAENWEPGDKGQLLVGPPGVGKTTTAYVVSDVLDMPLNQMNASDCRTSSDIAEMASTIWSTPADGKKALILLDEVDGWTTGGRINRDPMYDVLENPPCPILLTANDDYDTPDGVTNRVDIHKFKLGKRSRRAKLKDIIKAEGADVDDRDLEKLAERPDLRSAINDLQIMVESDVPLGDDDRTWEKGEFDAIPEMLSGNKWAANDVSPDDLSIWLDQAVAKEYRGLEAGVAYDCLSRADKWLGRARDTRNYRWWKFASALQRSVTEVRLTESHSGYIPDLFPTWFRHKMDSVEKKEPSAEARVYKKLKAYGEGGFKFSGSFVYFKNVLLEILRDLDEEERKQIALENRLEGDELEVLGLDQSSYEQWAGGKDSSVEEYGAKSQSVLDF